MIVKQLQIPDGEFIAKMCLCGKEKASSTKKRRLNKDQAFASASRQHLIQEGIGLAGCVTDCSACGYSRLAPRDDPVSHFSDHAVGDFSESIYVFGSLLLREQGHMWENNPAPDGS